MRKLIIPVAIFASAVVSSCGGGAAGSAKDIDVQSLETACDCGDAVLTVANEMKALVDAVGEGEPSKEQDEEFDVLEDKMDELESHCRKDKGFDKDQMMECESFKEAAEIMKEID